MTDMSASQDPPPPECPPPPALLPGGTCRRSPPGPPVDIQQIPVPPTQKPVVIPVLPVDREYQLHGTWFLFHKDNAVSILMPGEPISMQAAAAMICKTPGIFFHRIPVMIMRYDPVSNPTYHQTSVDPQWMTPPFNMTQMTIALMPLIVNNSAANFNVQTPVPQVGPPPSVPVVNTPVANVPFDMLRLADTQTL